ncbi:type II toxin-antitoxin system VapC family toxin [Sulfuriferula thiophila]|uniref:type II toxin-antitoxin system VapC family toxin n=1 Tax=Sulfuriferula thiophila TaxID=1781211 RepID=UPI000F614E30|nr:type II toxin-antitoxin system VapC family toxin [Sulfuriferula thiophila]
MRILLDTHVYLWWLQDSPKLSLQAREIIISATEVYVSSASIWEAAIKSGIGKLDVNVDTLVEEIEKNGFQVLDITPKHAARIMRLPDIHRDPFDRMLLAQALSEPLKFLTADSLLAGYSDLVDVI